MNAKKKMEWISVKNGLPKPFEVVWIYWRDREVLLGCRTYIGEEEINCDSSEGWYSFDDDKCRWTHWWQRVDASNLDKPKSPPYLYMEEEMRKFTEGFSYKSKTE